MPPTGTMTGATATATAIPNEREGYRVYYGDEREGEQVDSRCITDSRFTEGLVTRQVRE